MSPDEFARFLRDTHAKLGKVKATGSPVRLSKVD